ncbi:hypothetical protein A6302_01709 [Methylobrevis pamukkalensis]|uniref:DUF2339 domain-containing protein n=1 Tax=Methylobrevis pamukkalensis TaxID=1439726 RepID=A0A1E3H3L0_9HYPH|nr:hypothetical protein A6302_01709 [Methylobrevis pamukkalensis]
MPAEGRSAYIPGVLTAAGTATAFAAVFSAYALYGFLGNAAAFVALAVVALATLALALLHGPALAGLGLAAGYATPFLVASDAPALAPLALYLAVLTAASLGLARMRGWLWLAVIAVTGSVGWALLMILGGRGDGLDPAITALFTVAAFLLATAAFAAATHEAAPNLPPEGRDLRGAGLLALFTLPALLHLAVFGHGGTGLALLAALAAGFAGVAWRWPPLRHLALAVPAMLGLGHLGWDVPGAVLVGDPVTGGQAAPSLTDLLALETTSGLIGSAAAFGVAVGVIGFVAVLRGTARAPLGLAGAVTPLVLLCVTWLRVAEFGPSSTFGVLALGLGFVLAGLAESLIRRLDDTDFGADGAIAAYAVSAVAALALAFAILFERGVLTVTLALIVPALAMVDARRPLPALRWTAIVLALIVAARLVWDPGVAGGDPGATPVFNWLLWGYGLPALAFFGASLVFARRGPALVVHVLEAASLTLGTLTLILVIHHAMAGGRLEAPVSGLLEAALHTMTFLAVSLGANRLAALRGGPVFGRASPLLGLLGLAGAVQLLVIANPMVSGEPIGGLPVINVLAFAYLGPALLMAVTGQLARVAGRPRWYVRLCGWGAGLLAATWLTLAVRHGFHRPDMASGDIGEAELYVYSAVWLVAGVGLLVLGVVGSSVTLRRVAAAVILAVVVKVFLIDTAGLTGVWRALSYLGLGAVLILIGLAYQRLLGPMLRRREAPDG